jgi:hypothetical protein
MDQISLCCIISAIFPKSHYCVLVKLQEKKASNLGYKETLIPLSTEHLLLRNRDFTKMFANKKWEKGRGWEWQDIV